MADSSVGARIKHAASLVGGQRSLAKLLDIGERTVSAYASDSSSPQLKTLEDIAKATGVDLAWLVLGEGDDPMTGPSPRSLVSSYDPDDEHGGNGWSADTWKPRNKGARPELDVRLGAGEGQVGEVFSLPAAGGSISGHRVVGEWLFPDGFLSAEMKASSSATIVMEIVGDSMAPTYQPGDRVIVDLSQRRLVADTVYAISDGSGEPQIKRLQKVPFSDPPKVRIVSDNPALEAFEVDLERLTILGRICGVIARR